ncbi:RagB/SusD family nutrient uptake outer membrane protein [Pedobacter sp. FW305-3-2-15-E-R2A2]|uniref:RagB/SusD family nutrient uptake outer membrane protein n=1 Tax=Pedobacter sp. FW305-3-2-15-E-R2A2 TaxID=3140251 RepID=UPI003140A6E0
MKKILSFVAVIIMALLSGCAKYTDITPKGQNLLNRINDLDLLMNINYSGSAYDYIRQTMLINDNYLLADNVPNVISGVQRMSKILLTYDETGDRASLAATDDIYEGLYGTISKVANIVIIMGDQATGDAQLIKQLKAEAYILRAFLHYRLVNIYAKAYDPATAASDGGIPYVTDINFDRINEKKTVKEVYDNLLSDLDAGISSGALLNTPKNSMRIAKGFAYGVKAQVLLSMRNYSAALDAANEALKYNSTLEDHRPLLAINPIAARSLNRVGVSASDNVLYAYGSSIDPSILTASPEVLTNYETGNIIKDRTETYNYQYGQLFVGLPDSPAWLAINYQGNSAGMTTSDLILMKAECLIRTNKIDEGMIELNKIRVRRIDPANYTTLYATTEAQAMAYLQKTSRVEFIFTIRNFINIKRWNREGKYQQTITRTVNGKTYTLPTDSKLYIFPFPQSATQFNETLTQNY